MAARLEKFISNETKEFRSTAYKNLTLTAEEYS